MKFRVKEWDRDNFPALHKCANDASQSAQRKYLFWVAVNLTALVCGSAEGLYHGPVTELRSTTAIVASLAFFVGIAVSVLLAYVRWERIWFSGRAVAESVKSLAWKFSTGADPFPTTLPLKEAIARFTAQLTELMREHKDLAASFVSTEASREQVTCFMTGLRESVAQVRRDAYLAQRVSDQQHWYSRQAIRNNVRQGRWFAALIVVQGVACIATLISLSNEEASWHLGGPLAAIAASMLAWLQVKRHQELAQAYGYAAQELSLIAGRGPYVTGDDEVGRFVADAETAISREHTSWVARRETS